MWRYTLLFIYFEVRHERRVFQVKNENYWHFMYNTYGELYNYDITVTWPEVQNGGPRAAGSQVSMIHNFLILYPILLKFSLVCLNKVQLYYRSNFPLGLPSPLTLKLGARKGSNRFLHPPRMFGTVAGSVWRSAHLQKDDAPIKVKFHLIWDA